MAPPDPTPAPPIPHVGSFDGIRGLAVAAVLLYHGGFGFARGGFLGVSTFFTLSGFLITTLVMNELRSTGRLDLRRFWRRRIRRLLPASLIALTLVAVFGAVAADRTQVDGLRSDALAALGYVANWRFIAAGESYDAASTLSSPVQHFWSLAIEEQFYLVFPWVLALALAWGPRPRHSRVVGVFAVLTGLSVLVSIWLSVAGAGVTRTYYGSDARASELLIGVLLALTLYRISASPTMRRWLPRLGWAGLGVCAIAWITASQSSTWLYRGGLPLYAVASAAVVAAAIPKGPLRSFLEVGPLRILGQVSYGAYLYHWPVFLWLTQERTGLDNVPLFVLRVTVTVAIAIASYALVEEPIRESRSVLGQRPGRLAPITAGVAVALVLATAAPIVDNRLGEEAVAERRVAAAPGVGPSVTSTTVPERVPLRKVMLVGDSVIRQSAPTFAAAMPEVDVRWVGEDGVGPLSDQGELLDTTQTAIRSFDPDVVVVSLLGSYLDHGEGEPYELPDGTEVPRDEPLMYETWADRSQRLAEIAAEEGAVVVWTTIPPIDADNFFGYLSERTEQLNAIYRRLDGVTVAPWARVLAGADGGFSDELAGADGETVDARQIDGLHFTEEGNEILVEATVPIIVDAYRDGGQPRPEPRE